MKTAKNIKPMYAQHLGAGIFAAGWLCDECHTNSVIFDYDTGHYKCENPDCGWTGEKSYYPSDDDDSKDDYQDEEELIYPKEEDENSTQFYDFRCECCGKTDIGDDNGPGYEKGCKKSPDGLHYWEMLP